MSNVWVVNFLRL